MKLVETDEDEKHPNILFLRLESFVDPSLFNNIELSQDAVPNFRHLMKTCSSGNLTVPACGAGTANTEFEVMTGISVKFFGPGEYPFKSVLNERTGESIAFDLKSMGYGTHAIHNHRALFYNRNDVFANIGYDSFTSLEYMSGAAKTPKKLGEGRYSDRANYGNYEIHKGKGLYLYDFRTGSRSVSDRADYQKS